MKKLIINDKTIMNCFAIFIISFLALTVMSCSEEDFGYTKDEIVYKQNFEKTYGKIKSNQVWDFTTYNLKKLGLVGGPNAAMGTRTQGLDEPYSIDKIVFYPNNKQMPGFDPNATTGNNSGNNSGGGNLTYKHEEIEKWLKEQPIKEGLPLTFEKPEAAFTVIPFSAPGTWELHLVDTGNGKKFDYKITDNTKLNQPVVIMPEYITGRFYFYVKYGNVKDECIALYTGAPQSVTHLSGTNPLPSVVLGCETGYGEKDYKDLGIFISVPQTDINKPNDPDPEQPKNIYIVDDRHIQYMIEDKGSTVDFDFNDIVVVVHYYEKKNIDGTDEGYEKSVTAKLKWLCGTLPFKLKIGETSIPSSSDAPAMPGNILHDNFPNELKSSYYDLLSDRGVHIKGFNPNENNIQAIIYAKDGKQITSRVINKTEFPGAGETPYMIAVDEGTAIPSEGENINPNIFVVIPANQTSEVLR